MKIKKELHKRKAGLFILLGSILITVFAGCSAATAPSAPTVQTKIFPPEQNLAELPKRVSPGELKPLVTLKPQPAAEETMPYEEKLFSLSTRSTPLQDTLLGMAKEAGLNLVLEKGVNPREQVSVEIKNLPLTKALNLVLSASKYFYVIDGNILRIKAFETRMFHFDYPLLSNRPETDIGGDVLGSNSGAGGGTANNALSGEFSIEADIDEEDLAVWKLIEEALKSGGDTTKGLLTEQGKAELNPMAGTIIVTDYLENVLLVERYLQEIRQSLRRQVVIESKIVEVLLNQGHQYGIDWNYVQRNFGVDGEFTFSSDLASNTSALNIGWIKALGGNIDFSWFLDALATQGTVNVLSSPRLNVLNNQSALISVGRTIPHLEFELQSVTNPSTGLVVFEPVPTVVRSQTGVTLGVTPQISEDGITTLHIVPIVTDLVDFRSFSFDGNTFDVPVIDIRETDTMVRVSDGATIIIGGLIQEKNSNSTSRVPLLGDIPLLGKLFSQQIQSSEKIELVILMTPTIVER